VLVAEVYIATVQFVLDLYTVHVAAVNFCPHSCDSYIQITKENQRSERRLFVVGINTENAAKKIS